MIDEQASRGCGSDQPRRTPERITGSLLLSGLLLGLGALAIMIATGAAPGFVASRRGALHDLAPYVATFRMLNLLWAVSWVLLLAGLGMLARLLVRAGASHWPVLAVALALVASIAGVLHGTFHMSVQSWAAEEAARTGAVPAVYEPLDAWVSAMFRLGYVLSLASMVGFGWSLLGGTLVAPWVASLTVGWSALWLVAGVIGVGIPALVFVMPAVVGLALIVRAPTIPKSPVQGGGTA